jgi:cytochrome P450
VNASAAPIPPGPRARFPGQLVFALRGDPVGFFSRASREHGDVAYWRLGRLRYYLLSHPDHVRDLLVTHDAKFTKGPALRSAKVTLGEGLLTSEGDFHRRQRRLSQPAFHPSRVSSYAGVMARYAREQADTWPDGGTVDVHEAMMRVTLRVVAKTLFDADVAAEVEEIGAAMDVSVRMFTRAMSPLGPILNRLPLPSNRRFRRPTAGCSRRSTASSPNAARRASTGATCSRCSCERTTTARLTASAARRARAEPATAPA